MTSPVKQKSKSRPDSLEPANQTRLTIPDLVILSLLAERPMHGYEVNATLEDRKIRDWAPVSRPQIYYSLDKLAKLLALSWRARPRTFRKQLNARKKIIEEKLAGERATLADVLTEVGHPYHEAVWMLQLMIDQLKAELRWVERILSEADKRAPARHSPH